jgi:hypothetical protein
MKRRGFCSAFFVEVLLLRLSSFLLAQERTKDKLAGEPIWTVLAGPKG